MEWLLAKERKEQVRKAMQRMPRRDAEILLLKYTEDWSYRQLAGRLGISESAWRPDCIAPIAVAKRAGQPGSDRGQK